MKAFSTFTAIIDGNFRRSFLRTASLRLSAVLILMLLSLGLQAQTKSVSVLGDSYSTFEGFITPRTNHTWYYARPDRKNTDVSDVKQTWWHRVVTERGWRLCMNNSFSGSTVCNRGYNGNDYRDRSFLTRMDNLGCPDIIFISGLQTTVGRARPWGNKDTNNEKTCNGYGCCRSLADGRNRACEDIGAGRRKREQRDKGLARM